MSDELARIEVEVDSLAKPTSDSLMAARTAIRVRPELQKLFQQAKAEGWPSEKLADALHVRLPEYVIETENLWETALYLADEFMQHGDKILLVSRETGMAICEITDDDMYQPEPVLRESGNLAQPLPRLKPHLEGTIVQWQHEKKRDEQIVQKLAERLPQSELQIQEGDNRLLRATRSGRKKIVEMLRDELDQLIPPETGIVRDFFDLFLFCTPELPECTDYEKCGTFKNRATVATPITDALSSNLRHDPYTLLKQQITAQWARSIGRIMAEEACSRCEQIDASILDSLPNSFWLAEPNVAMALTSQRVLPIQDIKTVLLHSWLKPVACIHVHPHSYDCQSRELLSRWEVAAEFEYTLYVRPIALSVYNLKDVPGPELVAEVI